MKKLLFNKSIIFCRNKKQEERIKLNRKNWKSLDIGDRDFYFSLVRCNSRVNNSI